jgi:hypothetical protein
MILVGRQGRSTASFPAAIIHRVSLLEHLQRSGTFVVGIVGRREEIVYWRESTNVRVKSMSRRRDGQPH